jgi:two-component system LytT family response regulator
VKCAALDYILKPVQWMEVRESLKRLEQKKAQDVPLRQIELLLANLQPNYDTNKIAIPTATGYELFSVKEILHCKGENNYSKIYTISGRELTISKTLQWLEETLPNEFFFRIHKGTIVNLGHIRSYDKAAGNILVLDDGTKLEVAVRRNEELVERLQRKKALHG